MKVNKSLTVNNIKAIVFDLDDTLFDCYNQLVIPARKFALRQMISAGLDVSFEELSAMRARLSNTSEEHIYRKLIKSFNISDEKKSAKIMNAGFYSYYNYFQIKRPEIKPFPNVKECLNKLKESYNIFLLTAGVVRTQELKVESLGLKNCFHKLYFQDLKDGFDKEKILREIMKDNDLNPEEVLVVGNRIDSDIAPAKNIGAHTLLIKHGEHAHIEPKDESEMPDIECKNVCEINKIFTQSDTDN